MQCQIDSPILYQSTTHLGQHTAMYAVIFRAQVNMLDDAYLANAKQLRELAFAKYGCIDFVSSFEAGVEIAISYWKDKASIAAWKQDIEHLSAQKNGQLSWYKSYRVQVARIERDYQFPSRPAHDDSRLGNRHGEK
ncbi:antibiotic biosynthesis monooxygenase family protein [Alteromonas sp. H39]|uniref:antibiotic biosynthesis monooxygenase family protein n=1 Tax=Alteromonas sp. H39 TaxID=3389876 RepID=UPI0039DF8658